jgi:hypothetical protein
MNSFRASTTGCVLLEGQGWYMERDLLYEVLVADNKQ